MDNQSRDTLLEQNIDAYIKGHLSEEEAQKLWVELIKHPEYIPLLETEVDLSRYFKAQGRIKKTTPSYRVWIASAAAVIILIVSINVLTTTDQKPLKAWGQGKINLVENLSSAEVTRSETASTDPADSLLNTGFKAAISGQSAKAMEIFKHIIGDYDDSLAVSKAYLNMGILQYNSGNFAHSIHSFNKAIATANNNEFIVERSYWYLGNALVNTDQLQEARDAVQQAFSTGRVYKKEAFKLLKRLDYELGNIDFDDFEKQIKENE